MHVRTNCQAGFRLRNVTKLPFLSSLLYEDGGDVAMFMLPVRTTSQSVLLLKVGHTQVQRREYIGEHRLPCVVCQKHERVSIAMVEHKVMRLVRPCGVEDSGSNLFLGQYMNFTNISTCSGVNVAANIHSARWQIIFPFHCKD